MRDRRRGPVIAFRHFRPGRLDGWQVVSGQGIEKGPHVNHIKRMGLNFGALLVGAIVVLAGVAPSAIAQNGGNGRQPGGGGGGGGRGGFGGMGRELTDPAFTTRQMNKYADMLSLTAEQKSAVNQLLDGYTEETKAAAEKMRTKMADMRSDMQDDPQAGWAKMQESMKTFRDSRKKLDDGFVSDVKAVLTPKQLEVWPSVERAQRRVLGARPTFGSVSGERVDLIALVDEVKPSDDAKTSLKAVLDQYEQNLDRELIKRNEFREKSMDKIGELMRSGDTDAAQKLIQEGRDAAVRVRDVNRNFAKQIASALPDDQKAAFNDAFKKASFPDVYRPTQTTATLKAAAAFTDLTADQKDAVKKLSDTYDHSLSTVNDKLAAAQEDAEMNFNIADMRNRGGGGGQDSPRQQLGREKRDLDRTTTDSLKKILTDDQAAKLPKPDQQNGRGGGGGQGGQDAGQGGGNRRQRGRNPAQDT
jgi:Spy/CpxP family protein refolding chaperone